MKGRQVLKVVSNAVASYFWVTVLSPLSYQLKKMIGSGNVVKTRFNMQGFLQAGYGNELQNMKH